MSNHRLRYIAVVLPVAALALSVGMAGAASSRMLAAGAGESLGLTGVTRTFTFAAHQRSPIALIATGSAHVVQEDPTGTGGGNYRVRGSVQCLNVQGNHATIGLTIEEGTGPYAGHEGEAFYILADDNDPTAPDFFINTGPIGSPTATCAPLFAFTTEVTKGNIMVRD